MSKKKRIGFFWNHFFRGYFFYFSLIFPHFWSFLNLDTIWRRFFLVGFPRTFSTFPLLSAPPRSIWPMRDMRSTHAFHATKSVPLTPRGCFAAAREGWCASRVHPAYVPVYTLYSNHTKKQKKSSKSKIDPIGMCASKNCIGMYAEPRVCAFWFFQKFQ